MLSRLVLGLGPTALHLLDDVSDDTGDLVVVTQDEHRAETLRTTGIEVYEGDQTDRSVLESLDIDPHSVVVAGDDPGTNAASAAVARDLYPDAFMFAYAGLGSTSEQRARLQSLADRFLEPETVITEHLVDTIGDQGSRARQLHSVLKDIDGTLAIVTHDNPDPDAIASAVALEELASHVGCESTICYYGEISHQENRAFVNLLEFELENLDADDPTAVDDFGGFALVDHSRPGVNDQLPADTQIDIVIDHHPPRVPVEARFVDLRSGVGATSTLLVDYLRRFGLDIDTPIATGLLFGIQVDTQDFRREVVPEDFEAAAYLVEDVDMTILQRIEDPSVSAETLTVIGRAITNREQEGSVLLSCVGEIGERDALAQAADRLLNLEDVQATMVYGVMDGTIYASARARGTDLDLGEALRDAFGQIGSAGGHADMAGAQIELGVLEVVDDREVSLHEIVRSVVNDRFLDAIEARQHRLLGGMYARSEYSVEAFTESTALNDDPYSETVLRSRSPDEDRSGGHESDPKQNSDTETDRDSSEETRGSDGDQTGSDGDQTESDGKQTESDGDQTGSDGDQTKSNGTPDELVEPDPDQEHT